MNKKNPPGETRRTDKCKKHRSCSHRDQLGLLPTYKTRFDTSMLGGFGINPIFIYINFFLYANVSFNKFELVDFENVALALQLNYAIRNAVQKKEKGR